MREHLDTLGTVVRAFIERELPTLGPGWWEQGVLAHLTYQQRAQADDQSWSDLHDLDLAALLRVLDRNWDLFRNKRLVGWDDRNWLKEATSIRNRYSHDAPNRHPSPERTYRDLDTLTLLAQALGSGTAEAEVLAEARALARARMVSADIATHRDHADAQPAQSGTPAWQPGMLIRLKARPELTGVITRVDASTGHVKLTVFHGQATHTYFETQVEGVEIASTAHLSADDLKVRLTAMHVLHPSSSRLYSLNSGRIEYEPYQYRPVMKLISADRPRILVADDVGVGKTIEAALIIKELQARQNLESVLVICPKPLVVEDKWRSELKRFDEDFVHLDSATLRHCIDETRSEGRWPTRYRKAILPYSLLDERLLLGDANGRRQRAGLASLMPPVKFDLVIVDEAHHVRNSDTWSHRVVKHLLDSAEAAVLISATPIQTGNEDLRTLLRLLRPDTFVDNATFDLMREPNAHMAAVEGALRSAGEGWPSHALEALAAAVCTPWGARVLSVDPRCQELRDLLEQDRIEDRDRVKALRLCQSLNTFSSLINRTRRRDIGAFTTRKPETFEVDFTPAQAAVHDALLELAGRIAKSKGRGQSLDFVLSTLQRQAASCLNGLAPFIHDILNRRLAAEELSEADVDMDDLDPSLLEAFESEIRAIAQSAAELKTDPKLERLLSYVDEKREMPQNKLLVFSTFRHTLRYLAEHVAETGARVGLVHGGIPDDERRRLRARFAMAKEEAEAVDVLLSSEVGTEGLDYQFCDALVNYDLPWNPMRIEQRIGRIDRRGQRSESIAIKNMIVSGTIDAAIFQRCLVRIGVFQRALGGSEAILGELTRDIRRIGEDLTLTPAERAEKLQQLADNRIGRIQEQSDLEERESELFGLSLRKLDAEGLEQAASPWLATPQLARLVRAYLKDRGYERVDSLFERSVAVLRPSREVRKALWDDAYALSPSSTSAWMRWLSGGPAESSRRLTFDPSMASDPDVELLSPVHELVRVAATQQRGFDERSSVSLKLITNLLPADVYPISVYAWTYLGARDDFEITVTTTTPDDVLQLSTLLPTAEDSALDPPAAAHILTDLEERHFDRWVNARDAHVARTRTHVERQLASLRMTHQARLEMLEDQIANASHENIRRMRESELRNLQSDFEVRGAQLQKAISRSDVTATLLCSGTVEVVDE